MLTEADNALNARLAAIEFMVGDTRRLVYLLMKLSPDQIKAWHAKIISDLSTQSLAKTTDPAESDHLSDVVLQHIARQLDGVGTLMEKMSRQAR